MARETLKLQGIQRNRKRRKFDPGSSNEMMNIRPRDGVWEAIGDKKVYDTTEPYTPSRILAYHAMGEARNIIFIAGDLIISKNKDGGYDELMAITGDSVTAETINNILCISTAQGLRYFAFQVDAYVPIHIDFSSFAVLREGMPWQHFESSYSLFPFQYYNVPDVENYASYFNRRTVLELPADPLPIDNILGGSQGLRPETETLVGRFHEVRQLAHKKGCPTGPVSICFTVELFDGTEVAHTPILETTFADVYAYLAYYTEANMNPQQKTSFHVSAVSSSNENPDYYLTTRYRRSTGVDPKRELHGFKVLGLEDIDEGIVKRVNVYISAPKPIAQPPEPPMQSQSEWAKFPITQFKAAGAYFTSATETTSVVTPVYEAGEADKLDPYVDGADDPVLYKVGTISFNDCKSGEVAYIKFLDLSDDKIFTYDPLPIDNFSRHTLYSTKLASYNSRLFLSDVSEKLPVPEIESLGIRTVIKKDTVIRPRHRTTYDEAIGTLVIDGEPITNGYDYAVKGFISTDRTYLRPTPPDTTAARAKVQLQVTLTTDDGDKVAIGPVRTLSGSDLVFDGKISYPDARAKSADVLIKYTSVINGMPYVLGSVYRVALFQSSIHNYSFGRLSIGADQPGPTSGTSYRATRARYDEPVGTFMTFPEPSTPVLFAPSRVQASALNNPFVFPAINSYRVGSSEVIGLQTINNAISEGQFGEYPMIAFTKSGVWAMTIAEGERLISNIVPLANEICTNPDSITAVRKGIAFVTAEGLKIISGSKTVNISEIVRGNPATKLKDGAVMQKILSSSGYSHLIADVDFDNYIQGAKIGYDDYHEELIISNPSKHYSYLFNLEANAWYCASVRFDGFLAKFPYLFGFDGPVIYATNQEDRRPKNVLYISNEINFANVYSKFEQMLARGNFGRCRAMVFGTTDLENWKLLSIVTTPGGFDMRLPRGFYTCRSFAIVLDGTFEPDSYLEDFDVETKHRYGRRFR